jgi:hypothetical protein
MHLILGRFAASKDVELRSTPDNSEEILQVIYKDDFLLNIVHGVASGSVNRMLVNLLETKNGIR